LWPITSFVPFCVWLLLVEADEKILGRPASGGVALYLAAAQQTHRPHDDRGGSKASHSPEWSPLRLPNALITHHVADDRYDLEH